MDVSVLGPLVQPGGSVGPTRRSLNRLGGPSVRRTKTTYTAVGGGNSSRPVWPVLCASRAVPLTLIIGS